MGQAVLERIQFPCSYSGAKLVVRELGGGRGDMTQPTAHHYRVAAQRGNKLHVKPERA